MRPSCRIRARPGSAARIHAHPPIQGASVMNAPPSLRFRHARSLAILAKSPRPLHLVPHDLSQCYPACRIDWSRQYPFVGRAGCALKGACNCARSKARNGAMALATTLQARPSTALQQPLRGMLPQPRPHPKQRRCRRAASQRAPLRHLGLTMCRAQPTGTVPTAAFPASSATAGAAILQYDPISDCRCHSLHHISRIIKLEQH